LRVPADLSGARALGADIQMKPQVYAKGRSAPTGKCSVNEKHARSLSDLGDRSEHGGRARTEFSDSEAHSGAMERKIGELWAALPPAQ
jgi:hypothetical protein